jgi:YidC/Oxa1 family membrane protein insertase
LDFLLPIWNPLIVHPLEQGLRLLADPLEAVVPPGVAGGLAIIIFTILLRVVLLPLSLIQIRSQRHQLAIQPELKALQKKFKGDREGLAHAQMQLYKERGVNPAAGCLPLLIQMPILFGMYSAMNQLATQGLTLDQVQTRQIEAGRVVYAASRNVDPLPYNQWVLTTLDVTPKGSEPIAVQVVQNESGVSRNGTELLQAIENLTLTPGTPFGNPNPPNTASGAASIFLRAGVRNADGTINRASAVPTDQPYLIEVWVNTNGTNSALLDVNQLESPRLQDLAFKSQFLWLPSLGQPDTFKIPGIPLGIPGLLLIIMTITSFVSQRMATLPSEDPQQQAMMRSMAFMPLMYLFFFLGTPAGLVLYWLISNVFTMFQQYFTVGLGLLGGDIQRLTGRDLQPAWAHVPGSLPPTGDGLAGRPSPTPNGTAPAVGGREAGTTRRPRPSQGKGRKRGKR